MASLVLALAAGGCTANRPITDWSDVDTSPEALAEREAAAARAAEVRPVADGAVEVLSEIYTVDQKYRSMRGPQSSAELVLLPGVEPPELLWITGYEAVMVDAAGERELPQDFMCHSNLDLDINAHIDEFGWRKGASDRLFTLSQGQLTIEFPPGYGIPVLSNEALTLNTQVLNLNHEGEPFDLRHRVRIDFARDRDLTEPMRPLFMKAANGLVLVEGDHGYYQLEEGLPEVHGEGCSVGEPASGRLYEDVFGKKFSGHWVVPPGRHVYRTLVTEYLSLPYDTTCHYAAAHLHPFAESLELKDLTAGESVFESRARDFGDRIGLESVDAFSSADGLPVWADHQYELVATYDNTSGEPQDAMAVLFLYCLDKDTGLPGRASSPTG